MAKKYLDYDGMLYFWQKIRNTFVSDIAWDSTNKKLVRKKKTGTSGAEETNDIVTFATVATSGSYNDLSNKPTIPTITDTYSGTSSNGMSGKAVKSAIDAIDGSVTGSAAAGKTLTSFSQTNGVVTAVFGDISITKSQISDFPTIPTLKNVFGKVKVGNTTIEADTTQDTLELEAGSNVTLTPDATNDKVTIAATDTTYESKSAASGGTAVSLVTTGEKYTWNQAEPNVNADWTAVSGDAQILNKPTLGGAAAKDVVTSISSDSVDLPTVTAVKQYVSTAVSGGAAFQGTAPTTFAPTNYTAGWYWVVGTAGTYAGEVCEPGDMIFATANGTTYSASDFDVVQTNLDITSITNAEIDTIVAA